MAIDKDKILERITDLSTEARVNEKSFEKIAAKHNFDSYEFRSAMENAWYEMGKRHALMDIETEVRWA